MSKLAKKISRELTPHRSLKKHTRTVKETLIWYVLGSLACVYLGYLCGACWVSGNDFNEFSNNFREFVLVQHHYIVGVTSATLPFIGTYWLAFSMAFILIFTKIEHPFAGEEYGVAKWGNAKEFSKMFSNHDKKNEVVVNTGDVKLDKPLVVNTANYWIAEDVYLSINNEKTSNLNMLVVGPPGSGKSFRLARPMLSNLCGNFLITDPKGELYKQTGQYFEDNGYEVMVMNVESEDSMPMSIHFNPFRYIRNESDIMSIAGILMKSTTPPDDAGGGNDQFFEQSAEVLLTSIIYYMVYHLPPEARTWKTFVELLDSTAVYTGKKGGIENREGGIWKRMFAAQADWAAEHDTPFPGWVAVDKFYNGAAETTSSIVASLDAHCRYMKLQCVVDLLSEDEINIGASFGKCEVTDNCSTGKRILYIVTSEDKRYYDWIPSMVYSLFFDELYHLTAVDESLHETLPQHLTFLLDEFSNVTLPDSFVEKLSTMRSRNMSAVIIVQNLIQLKRKFPKYDMDKDLIGNCAIIDILGAPDMDSCEYLSKHFGTQTIHKASDSDAKDYKGQSSRSEDVMEKPLLSAEDIFAMKKDGECAIVVKGTDPLYQMKCQMENSDFVKLLCRKNNPYNPAKRREERALIAKNKRSESQYAICGDSAKEEAQKLREKGVAIVHLTEADVDLLSEVNRSKTFTAAIPPTIPQLKQFEENRLRYEEEHNPTIQIDFGIYVGEDSNTPEGKKHYQERIHAVRKLINRGYTKAQIRAFHPLIMHNYSAEAIEELFAPDTDNAAISSFIEALGE